METNKKLALALALASIILCAAQVSLATPILDNGSLTGAINNAGVSSGWVVLSPSPDTMDENNNVGISGLGDFAAAPSTSPDGGTWVGFADDPQTSFQETFGQLVSGFAIGTSYTVNWDQANFGYAPDGFVNDDFINLFIDGIFVGAGSLNILGNGWTSTGVDFSATSNAHQISFGVGDEAGRSYLSIDGISISATTSTVPEPASIALLGLGLAGVGFSRKKKSA